MQTLFLVAVFCGTLLHDGVQLPAEEGFGHGAQLVTAGGIQQISGGGDLEFANFLGDQLPPSDRAKWYMTVYVDRLNDPESRLLLRDLDQHPALAKLKSWCKFQMVDRLAAPSQEARMLAQEIGQKGKPVPSVLVYANPDDPVFGTAAKGGWHYVYDGGGYGGDADMLARNLYEAIRKEYERRGVSQCPGPYCPQPVQPNLPQPNPNPYQPGPYQPPPYQPADPWPQQPMPRMDEPLPGAQPFPVATEYVLMAIAAALVGFIAWRKGWLDPPTKPPGTSGMLLLLALTAGLLAGGCRAAPCCAEEADPVSDQADVGRFHPDDNPAIVPEVWPEDCPPCELRIVDQTVSMIRDTINAIKWVVRLIVGLAVANLLVGLRLLYLIRQGHT